ncbi:MAG: hypothetical protein P0119_10175 [Nitrospira sp.]|nr:hypothetical protein [Nitrospira sp.]
MALQVRHPSSPLTPRLPRFISSQRFADIADHVEDHTTHARHHPDLPPKASRSDREEALATKPPAGRPTIHHEEGAPCVTPSLCDC